MTRKREKTTKVFTLVKNVFATNDARILPAMKTLAPDNLTGLLVEWREGDKAALDRLMPLVYDELRKLAAMKLAQEKPGQTLQAPALVQVHPAAPTTQMVAPTATAPIS